MGYLEELQLEQTIQGMESLKKEFIKLQRKLEAQYEKLDGDVKGEQILFYVPVKYSKETEQIPIRCRADLQELWEASCIRSARTLEKYENKLDSILKETSRREKRTLINNTLRVLKRYIEEVEYDLFEEKNKLKQEKGGV